MAKRETVFGCRIWSDDGDGEISDATYSSRDSGDEAESVGYAINAALRARVVDNVYESLEVLAAAMAYVTIDHDEPMTTEEDRALVEAHKAVEEWWCLRCQRLHAMRATGQRIKKKEAPNE